MFDAQPRPTGAPLWVHIAVGVFIGITASAIVIWKASSFVARAAAEDAAKALRQATEQSRRDDAAAAQARAAAVQAERQRAADAAIAAQQAKARLQAETERREQAWNRYYRKPAECDENRGGAWTTDCANNYIRARSKFAELYDAGKL